MIVNSTFYYQNYKEKFEHLFYYRVLIRYFEKSVHTFSGIRARDRLYEIAKVALKNQA